MKCYLLLGATTISPMLLKLVLLGLTVVMLGTLLRQLRQPYILAYILAGVLLGPEGMAIITDKVLIDHLGEMGLILLLFFIGMEVDLPNLLSFWKPAVLGTALQIGGSLLAAYLVGTLMGWSPGLMVLMGFILSLSSSAVVIKLLEDQQELNTPIGQKVLGILLTQDMLIVPMLIAVNYLSGHVPPTEEIIRQLVGGAILVVILLGILRGKKVRLPFAKTMLRDHELQVFVGLILCFGFALFTAIMGLSAALGAFVAGMIVHASRSTRWFHETLHPFRVLFVSIFFVSVGMLISFRFIMENWQTLALVITAIYVTNHFINTLILRNFGSSWRESWYGGALLAQIGELSFVLSATGYSSGIFTDYVYQLTVAVIALTLFFSPFWIALTKKLCHYRHSSTLKPEKV